jgi:hypothetical protein
MALRQALCEGLGSPSVNEAPGRIARQEGDDSCYGVAHSL